MELDSGLRERKREGEMVGGDVKVFVGGCIFGLSVIVIWYIYKYFCNYIEFMY